MTSDVTKLYKTINEFLKLENVMVIGQIHDSLTSLRVTSDQLGRAVRSTAVRHPWRTTARTSPYVPYVSAVRPVRLRP